MTSKSLRVQKLRNRKESHKSPCSWGEWLNRTERSTTFEDGLHGGAEPLALFHPGGALAADDATPLHDPVGEVERGTPTRRHPAEHVLGRHV
jgi:hypothetical protein